MLFIVYNTSEFKVFVASIRVGPIVGLGYGHFMENTPNLNWGIFDPDQVGGIMTKVLVSDF